MDLFSGKGRFYKGNLHTHTTRSDGFWPPEQTLQAYRQAGYDFVALTDHNRMNRENWGMGGDFLVLPGMEYQLHYGDPKLNKTHHFVLLPRDASGIPHDQRIEDVSFLHPRDAQAQIDRFKALGNEVILCHPEWSNTHFGDYGALRGLLGVEVYNTGCHWENDTGLAHHRWDEMLREGQSLYAFATDDCHQPAHFFGGWVMVHAEDLTHASIMDSLLAGRFYASTGPEIYRIAIEDDEIVVDCSPCDRVYFLTDRIGGVPVFGKSGPVTQARLRVPTDARYLRVQCVNKEYGMAWSQPIDVSAKE